jgi:hypothetical protein
MVMVSILNAKKIKEQFNFKLDNGFYKIANDLSSNHPDIKMKNALLKVAEDEIKEKDSAYLPELDIHVEKAKIYDLTESDGLLITS